jgi:hypothetical protein
MPRLRRFRFVVGRVSLAAVVAAVSLVLVFSLTAMGANRRPATVHASPTDPLRVLLMGDSLANASRDFFTEAVTANGTALVDSRLVHGGTAICDWLPSLASTLREFTPEVAVVELSGNSMTPCMVDPATGQPYDGAAWLEKYRVDATRATSIFKRFGVDVYWMGAPLSREDTGGQATLNAMYKRLAQRSANSRYANAGAAVLDNGKYTDYLPCEAGEPCTDTDPATGQPAARVRGPDGGHFCPNGPPAVWGVTQPCTTWSSGAWRFGNAMAAPIIAAYSI